MNEQDTKALLDAITPDRLERLATSIEARQPSVNRGTAPLDEVIESLGEGLPAMSSRERAGIERRLREAIIETVSQIEGMTFVEGDS